jgi:hypothetical protein
MANLLDDVILDPDTSIYCAKVMGDINWSSSNQTWSGGITPILDAGTDAGYMKTWFVNSSKAGNSQWSNRMSFYSRDSDNNIYQTIHLGSDKHGWVYHGNFGWIYIAPDLYYQYITNYWDAVLYNNGVINTNVADYDFLYYFDANDNNIFEKGIDYFGLYVYIPGLPYSNNNRKWIYFTRASIGFGGNELVGLEFFPSDVSLQSDLNLHYFKISSGTLQYKVNSGSWNNLSIE